MARRHAAAEREATESRVDRRPFDKFDRLKSQVGRDEIASEVYQEMVSKHTPDLDLEKLEREQTIKAELEKLKRKTTPKKA